MVKKLLSLLTVCSIGLSIASAQITRVEPPMWWSGMKSQKLQLMIYGDGIGDYRVTTSHQLIRVEKVIQVQNHNYLFIDLDLAGVGPGTFTLIFNKNGKEEITREYNLLPRKASSALREGFNPSDVLYLITPDRFVNGNEGNDMVAGMKEQPDRDNIGGRHGGDIKGIVDKLDYLKDMGFTAIWLNPVLENDQLSYSYHGYATTDFYKVDPRFGSNEEYRAMSELAEQKGIKLIMDMIVNHSGDQHWWMKDLPSDDWLNFQDKYEKGEFVITTHRKTVIQDPYVADADLRQFVDGWFVTTMPDLNQRNPLMAEYLIQNSIWWIEYANLAGIRMDTYPYPDMYFMTDWTCRVMDEYPNFNVVGEEWHGNPAIVAHWQRGKDNPNGYTSCLPSVMDFPLQDALAKGLVSPEEGWRGISLTYEMLANDFQYADPYNIVVFPDNHDMSRFFTQVGHDYDLFKLGMTYILTIRGIPQLYYGTEILMKNPESDDHGVIRSDFPGGWKGDNIDGFSGKGLTDQQKSAKQFLRGLLNWRKTATVIHDGSLKHFLPQDGVYVFFRYDRENMVMVVLSKNPDDYELDLSRFAELIDGNESGKEVLSGKALKFDGTLTVPAMSPMVIEIEG